MSDLVEKVASAIRANETVSHDRHIEARSAIAVVLREMMEPSNAVAEAGAFAVIDDETRTTRLHSEEARTVLIAMLRAFAAEHGIAIRALATLDQDKKMVETK